MTTIEPAPPNASPSFDWQITAARKVARVMDGYRLDPIMGFVLPGIGDAIGGLVGLAIVALAWRRKVGRATLARMLINVAIDTGIGAIPLFGDLFDMWFHANTRNANLLERATISPKEGWRDWVFLVMAFVAMLTAMCVPCLGIYYLVVYLQSR